MTLSPFVFILCAEVLANSFKVAERENRITGVQVAATAPRVSHLLFADDTLFFCKAEKQEVDVINQILQEYSRVSGQKVSFSKSSIVFGHKVETETRNLIKEITGITKEGGTGLYLGLPEAFIGSKIETLRFLEEKVAEKINSWSSKFLSQGGKEVMIKAVAMALPTYTMSCFLLPKTLCTKLVSLFSNFWWKNQATGKGIHWKAWDKLTEPKAEGGLGFRDVEGFNLAMLGKQLWRMANKPESLMARIFEARYFPSKSPLEASLGSRPSFAWRSIYEAKMLMQEGMRKEFGDGHTLRIAFDPWLPSKPPRPPRVQPGLNPYTLHISMIKDFDSDEWNWTAVKSIFVQEDIHLIGQVRPSFRPGKTRFSWIYNHNGDYSVKSGYCVWQKCFKKKISEEVLNPNLHSIFQALWKANTSPKIKNFLWRGLSNCLAVGSNMTKKRLTKAGECPRCGSHDETVNHVLFHCSFARLVGALSSLLYVLSSAIRVHLHELC